MIKQYRRFVVAFVGLSIVLLLEYSGYSLNSHAGKKLIYSEIQQISSSHERQSLIPVCENVLVNMTRGRWVRKVDLMKYKDKINDVILQEKRLVMDLQEYWVNNGVQSVFWSKYRECGYKIYQTQPRNSSWPQVGSWCDPDSTRPCCSNNMTGACMAPSEEYCNCPGCVDVRKYKHAEASDWIVEDDRCKWIDYDASQVCDVIERSPFGDIQFVGDSFARKMFRTLAIMITGDFENGWKAKKLPTRYKSLCRGMQTYYWRDCRVRYKDISKVLYPSKLCGGRGYLNFTLQYKEYLGNNYKREFLNLVKNKLNVSGSLIVLSIGQHMCCSSKIVINEFLGPAVDEISKRYGSPATGKKEKLPSRWPQIVLCLPPTVGLLKPPRFLKRQNQTTCDKYGSDMLDYAKKHDISVLDVRPISRFIHSFDGSHQAFAVNKLKNLILLNHIASL